MSYVTFRSHCISWLDIKLDGFSDIFVPKNFVVYKCNVDLK